MIMRSDHEEYVSRAALAGLEAKIMKMMSENSNLRTTVTRQVTQLSALQARLEELEDGPSGGKRNRADKKVKENEAAEKIEQLETRVATLEKSVNGQRARTRGMTSASATVAGCSLSASMHGGSLNDLGGSMHSSAGTGLSKSMHQNSSPSDIVYRSKAATAAADHAGSASFQKRRMSMAHMNRLARSGAMKEEGSSLGNLYGQMDDENESSLNLSKAFVDSDDLSLAASVHGTKIESKDSFQDFPEESFPPPVFNPESPRSPPRKRSKESDTSSPRRSSKSEGRRRSRRQSMSTAAKSSTTPSSQMKSSSSSDIYQPFTSEEFAKAQGEDSKLLRYLENPAKEPLYPKFQLSTVKADNDKRICLFRKRVYVPESMREAVMMHYFQHSNGDKWASSLCKHKTWPTIDTDITDFVSRHRK